MIGELPRCKLTADWPLDEGVVVHYYLSHIVSLSLSHIVSLSSALKCCFRFSSAMRSLFTETIVMLFLINTNVGPTLYNMGPFMNPLC